MTIMPTSRSLPVSLFAAALLIGAAPAAYAQCEAGTGGSMIQDMAKTQESAGAAANATTGQSGTTTAESDIQPDQGGVTTDKEGAATAQSGGTPEESGATTAGAGGATTSSGETQAVMDSPEIEGADEERIVAMLEQEGYSDISSVVSCGAYYEVEAKQGDQQAKLQVDMATGRVNPL
ncbi:PepSY domain-containing protein [Rhodospirillaceae bacterium SYSU D60014]|uniref:PepSY domain-containing protein n=1 Tax=Virgifigura deserti TaxID=2268457 RepID=UPI000E67241E